MAARPNSNTDARPTRSVIPRLMSPRLDLSRCPDPSGCKRLHRPGCARKDATRCRALVEPAVLSDSGAFARGVLSGRRRRSASLRSGVFSLHSHSSLPNRTRRGHRSSVILRARIGAVARYERQTRWSAAWEGWARCPPRPWPFKLVRRTARQGLCGVEFGRLRSNGLCWDTTQRSARG